MRILELLVLLVPVATAAAPQQRLLVISSPPDLELRPGASSTLRINAPDTPELRASVGEVGPPRPVASGIYEATYRAPRESHPQVAIVTAAISGAYGWVAVPLAGTGELEVKTKPNGEATARVGDRWFGPVRADSTGRAVVPIVVPPGTTHAMVGSKRVSLAAPEPVRPFAVLDRSTLAASTRATVAVRVFVVEPTGAPDKNAPLRAEVSEGVLSAPREIEPGVFEASWDVPPAVPGEAWLAVWLAGERGTPSRVFLPRPPTAPDAARTPSAAPPPVAKTPPVTKVPPPSSAPRTPPPRPRDAPAAATRPPTAASAPPASTNAATPPKTATPSQAAAPPATAASPAGSATTRSAPSAGVPSPATASTAPAPATTPPAAAPPSGAAPVPAPVASAPRPSTASPRSPAPAESGAAAPVSPPVAQAEIPPRIPPRVPARPAFDTTPYREPPSTFGIDLRTGAAWDADGLRALTAGLQLAWFPYALGGTVGFALDGSGLAVREKGRVVTPDLTRDLSTVARVFPIQGLALVRVPLLGGAVLAGAGGGSAYGNVRVASRGRPTENASGWAPAFTGLLGYGHPAGAGSLFAEVRGQYVDAIAEQRVPGALELVSVSVGYRIGL